MVGTRTKNKNTHPALPVMTDAAKVKAGLRPAKRQTKKTKAEQIRELEARLAAFEHPDDATSVSKEPLVSKCTPPSLVSLTDVHCYLVLKR